MNKNSKIYVSGHSGMLGSAMVRHLKVMGYTNIVTRTHKDLDLTKQADVEAFFAQEQPEYVFHIAAKTGGVMLNKKYPVDYLTEGTYIALNVLQAANKYNTKGVVYVSSAKIYPEEAPQPISEKCFMGGYLEELWEEYALAKIVGTKYCESVAKQYHKHFVAAILPTVYGNENFGTSVVPMLVDKFVKAVINHERTVTIWGTGKARREFINSNDVADALLFLMEHGRAGERYNVGSGAECTIRKLAETLQRISGFDGELVFDVSKPESAQRQFLDSSIIYKLGWQPKISFEDGLMEIYQEHLQNIIKNQ